MLSALTDGRRWRKLFAGRKRSQSSRGGGAVFAKQPALPIGRNSTVAHLSPVCSPHAHLAPFLVIIFFILLVPLTTPLHVPSFSLSAPPATYSSDLAPLSVRKSPDRQAGREWDLFFSALHPIRSLLSAPGSFTCCMTGPALYWNKSSPRTDAHVCMHVCAWASETSQDFLRVLMGILSWAWPPDYHPALECMCVYVCIINASGCDLPTLLSAWFMLSPSTLCFSASRPLSSSFRRFALLPTSSLCCFQVLMVSVSHDG